MKVRTVGILAALGMLATSASVWSLTKKNPNENLTASTEREAQSGASTQTGATAAASFTLEGPLRVQGRLGHSKLRADAPGETYIFANVSGGSASGATSAAPMNLAIVVDRSGSMKGKRLTNALDAARGMIHRLRDGDVLSVIAYNTQTESVVPPTTLDSSSRERAISALNTITAQGDTCISCGIDAGMAALRARSGMVTRVLLLSDGEPTAGVKDVEGFRRIAASARAMDCPISSIGIDIDYNERVLAALALDSNGQHYFAQNGAELERAFDRELSSLTKTVARETDVELTLAPGVEVEKVFDRTFRQDGRKVVVPMGTFASGEEKTLLVKVRLPRGPEGDLAVADLAVKSIDPVTGRRQEVTGHLGTELTLANVQTELDPVVAGRLTRTETADTIEAANRLFNSGDVEGARRRLQQKINDIETRKGTALRTAPKPVAGIVSGDFDNQSSVLNKADERFKQAPPSASPGQAPADTAAGKSGTRRNVEEANPFRQ